MTENDESDFYNETVKRECLQKQLEEMDIINSIYCNPGEFKIDDHSVTADINEYLEGRLGSFNNKLDYNVCLTEDGHKIDIKIELPNYYPLLELADVTLRSSLFNTSQEKSINKKIRKFLREFIEQNSTHIYEVITWIQENISSFKEAQKKHAESENGEVVEDETVDMERLWIVSHHIKSKTKRHDIVKNAKDLNLTGFLLSGKPGFICVEGCEYDTHKFWKLLRQMKWQRISVKKSETETRNSFADTKDFRLFTNFRELLFMEDESGVDGEIRMNLSLLMKYLEQHNCGGIVKELLGL